MRVGSLFSGIGGLDLGLERAGMEIVWQVEIDEWCRRVLERHFPNAVRYGDVRSVGGCAAPEHGRPMADADAGRPVAQDEAVCTGREAVGLKRLASVDLICGGFPCQPVSVAGARKGEADERWLWPEFLRIVREVRPRWVLVENVPGLRSIDDGRLFGEVVRDLAGCGYDTEWNRVSAASVGALHLRERVFIVANSQIARNGRLPVRPGRQDKTSSHANGRGEVLADSPVRRGRRAHDEGAQAPERNGATALRDTEGNGERPGLRETQPRIFGRRRFDDAGWWATEPDVGRVAHGIPSRVDRLRGLGNAVVPQVAEYIGRMIMEIEAGKLKGMLR